MSDIASTYDELPYDSRSVPVSHPARMAARGILFGMSPPDVRRCRVLELGCAEGGNLLPMALGLPDSRFVGIDLSPVQIDLGRQWAERLGLRNLDLRTLDILEIAADFGEFDYIIAHGVYSWAPAEVRQRMLELIARHLSPRGLAYVSYNIYPGWHFRRMIRDMMQYHVRPFTDARSRISEARRFLDFLIESLGEEQSTYAAVLKEEAEELKTARDTYLYHEHLEIVNEPCYFHEFVSRAAEHGLQYVTEARYLTLPDWVKPEAVARVEAMASDWLAREQYLDFLRRGIFRRSLLCHADVALTRPAPLESLERLDFSARARPLAGEAELAQGAVVEFETLRYARVATDNALAKTILVVLSEQWPRPISYARLRELVAARLPRGVALDESFLEVLMRCAETQLVELQTAGPVVVNRPTPRPEASLLARLQAPRGDFVTNLRHFPVELTPFDRVVLQLLDGQREREEMVEILVRAIQGGAIEIERPADAPLPTAAELRDTVAALLETSLAHLCECALLVA